MTDIVPTLIQTRAGTRREITNKWGEKRTVTIDREWDVLLGDEKIGSISYSMLTRERRGKGLRYVFARWQSPGWRYRGVDHRGLLSWFERPSKKACIESLLWQRKTKENNQ